MFPAKDAEFKLQADTKPMRLLLVTESVQFAGMREFAAEMFSFKMTAVAFPRGQESPDWKVNQQDWELWALDDAISNTCM